MNNERCNCFEENLKAVNEKIKEQIPEHENFKSNWKDRAYILGGGENEYAPVNPKIEFSYQGFKKSGDLKANRTKDTVSLTDNHCCFCGRKYKRAS